MGSDFLARQVKDTLTATTTKNNPHQTEFGYERKRDYRIHLEVDPTEPWIFSLGKNTQLSVSKTHDKHEQGK